MKELQIIEDIVEQLTGIRPSRCNLRSRKGQLCKLRQLVMYCLKTHTKASLAKIGSCYKKDHATAHHAKKAIQNILDTNDPEYANLYKNIINKSRLALSNTKIDPKDVHIGKELTHQEKGKIEVRGIAEHCGDYKIHIDSGWVYLKNCEIL